MKIYNNILDFDKDIPVSVIIGTFDGVHKGHWKILDEFVKLSKEKKLETIIITFNPHPRKILYNQDFKLLNTFSEKVNLFKNSNIDNIIIQNFDLEFSKLDYRNFFENFLLKKLNLKLMVLGYDNHFGRNREGNFLSLKDFQKLYKFDLVQLEALRDDDVNISSTKIRNLILDGEIYKANRYLNYNFFLEGKVINGNKIGSKIGFPTANIFVEDNNKIIPKNGVYSVEVKINNHIYKGISNIGLRPTIEKTNNLSIEVHIFDFDQNIYEKKILVYFVERIRDEKKFQNIDELKLQISQDIIKVKNL